jgi:hypothetical protein
MMVEWLNQNQGFITAFLTFVNVFITVFLAYIAWKTSKISIEAKEISNQAKEISEKHLKLVADLEKQRSRPYVLFNLYNENGRTFATVKNYGLTSANDVKISVEPKLIRASSHGESILTSQTIFFLPPNFEIKDNVGTTSDFYQNFEEAKFSGKVNYKDSFGNEYENDFYIDLDAFKRRIFTKDVSTKEIVEELKRINQNLINFLHKQEK